MHTLRGAPRLGGKGAAAPLGNSQVATVVCARQLIISNGKLPNIFPDLSPHMTPLDSVSLASNILTAHCFQYKWIISSFSLPPNTRFAYLLQPKTFIFGDRRTDMWPAAFLKISKITVADFPN